MNKREEPQLFFNSLLTQIVSIGWFAAKIISWKLWLSDRLFPLIPPFTFVHYSSAVHLVLYAASLLLLVVVCIKPARLFLFILMLVEVISCLADQNRWQPWQYQYLTFVFVLWLYWKQPVKIKTAIAFIIISTYFYSGLSKLNVAFLQSIWVPIILKRFLHIPSKYTHSAVVYYGGFVVPMVELLGATLLCGFKARRIGAIMLILAGVFNLFMLGPLGINYNLVVWPWNAAMIVLIYLLFYGNDDHLSLATVWRRNMRWLLLFWALLPLTNLFGFWDEYLSSVLYSGKTKHLYVCIDTTTGKLPQELVPYVIEPGVLDCPNALVVSISRWSMGELKVPCYPEERVFEKLAARLRVRYANRTLKFYVATNNGSGRYIFP